MDFRSQQSDRGKKGAKARQKSAEAQAKLKGLSQGDLLKFKGKTAYEDRAKQLELKRRGLIVKPKKRKR